ncbi:MAG: DUF3343 domain-containing protein [Clostridioides sp.]|nr:DUF3343 domain-containing protein [Clostridioides sp.]
MNDMYIISFNSTHHAMRSEKLLQNTEIHIKILPTPREISASCGLSIMFSIEDIDLVKKTLDDSEIDFKGIYHLKKNDEGKREAERLF